MKKKPKLPVETVKAWVPWALLGLALAEVGLSIFQWVELRTVEAGGTTVCALNATVNCETVWTSPFAQRLGAITGMPVAGLGLVWGLAAVVCAGALLWRARTLRGLRRAVLPVRTVAVVGAMATVTFVAGSVSAGALCLTCLGTYLLVLGFALVAWRGLPGALAPRSGEWLRALGLPATVAAVVWIGLLLRGRDPEPRFAVAPAAAAASPTPAAITQFLASRPTSEKQALSDALARFARTPVPAGPLPPPRMLRGPIDAPVHLVEWTDVLCPHCRHLNETLEQLRQSIPPDRLSIEARQYPLDGRCNPSVPQQGDGLRCEGALVQICLEKAPDYWTLRDKLFAAQRSLTRESMMDIASSGVTPRSQLEACMASDETKGRLADDLRYAELYHPTGTPLVAINGKVVQPQAMFLYALVMASGDPTAPVLTSALPPARHASAQ
jgi:protein-disulfide isomerase/uncharacterized membrane protein